MAWPQDILDKRVELNVGGTWTDITGYAIRDPITITRGRSAEAGDVDPGQCTMTLNNRDGRFSPRNPLSPYYGQLGRNTPIRVSVHQGSRRLVIPKVTGAKATTPDATALDITGDIDIRVDLALDNWNDLAGAQFVELAAKQDLVADQRSWRLMRLPDGTVELTWTTAGTGASGISVHSTIVPVVPPSGRLAIRATLDVDNGQGGYTVAFYTAPTIAGPWAQLGAQTVTTSGTTSIFNSTAPLEIGDIAGINLSPGIGRYYAIQVRNGIDGTPAADADFTALAAGTTSFTDGAGRAWTLVGGAEITDRRVRFVGEVSAWPARWDVSGQDVYVPIQAAGILRRLGQGAKALASTLRRRIPSFGPLAYWPMEEQATAVQAYSPIAGVQPMLVSGLAWAQTDSLPSSSALPALASTSGAALPSIYGRVPAPSSAITGWCVQYVYRLDTANTTMRTFLRVLSTGTVNEWYIQQRNDLSRLIGKDADGNTLFSTDLLTGSDLYGQWIRVELSISQSGSTVTWAIIWTDVGGEAGAVDGTFTGTLGRPTAVSSPPGGYSPDLDGMAIGHISAWPVTLTTAYVGAVDAWAGETAGERMVRLSGEESVPLTVYGLASEQEQVGAQRPQSLVDLFSDAADADGGILFEQREASALAYRDRAGMYNQPPALALDYAANDLVPPLEPTDDDQATRNDVTVQRADGSAARAVLEEGPLSVLAPPDGVGVYDESVTLSLFQDEQAEPIAWWRVHLGTWDEARYPRVSLNLARRPGMVDDAVAVDVGDRMTIANLPAWMPPGGANLLVQGYTETITQYEWLLDFTCTPAGPWTVSETAYVEGFEDSAYDVTMSSGGTLPWTRTSEQAHSGSWSLRSGAISNNQTSDAVLSLPSHAAEVSFWYRVSSEASGPGFEGDRLLVYADDTQVLRAQGTASVAWTRASLDVTGKSTVTFRYAKDNSASAGEDAAYIDDLAVTLATTPLARVDTDGSELAAAVDADDTTLTVAITAGPVWTTDGNEFPLDIQVGGEVMTVTSIASPVSDRFQRLVTSGWGTADTGQAWTVTGGSAADFSVKGG
ncbi:hypothetical protein [Streptomyces sp. Inha503]|uniref:hypothetical protein n=1 Tax=Streptomyces sp. Inha503 TaxID=3383314 RepID=UPI0039A24019